MDERYYVVKKESIQFKLNSKFEIKKFFCCSEKITQQIMNGEIKSYKDFDIQIRVRPAYKHCGHRNNPYGNGPYFVTQIGDDILY